MHNHAACRASFNHIGLLALRPRRDLGSLLILWILVRCDTPTADNLIGSDRRRQRGSKVRFLNGARLNHSRRFARTQKHGQRHGETYFCSSARPHLSAFDSTIGRAATAVPASDALATSAMTRTPAA